MSQDWGPLDTSHPANKDADPQGAAEPQNWTPTCLAMGLCGQNSLRVGNVVLAALLSQPALCLWLLFPICHPTPHSLAAAPRFPAHALSIPLASLNTRRCCVGDLSSYRCSQNAKLLTPALWMSAERKPPCREPRRSLEDMLDFRAPSQVSQRQQLPTSTLCLCPPFTFFLGSGCLAERVLCVGFGHSCCCGWIWDTHPFSSCGYSTHTHTNTLALRLQ